MTSAGRILIIPKGNYDSSVTYEMLDLVKHNGKSWLAKKTSVGIEPSESNADYWHKFLDNNVVNNLNTEEEGSALDATQGKILNDKIAKIFDVGFTDEYRVMMSQVSNGKSFSTSIPLVNAKSKNILIHQYAVVGETIYKNENVDKFIIQKFDNNFCVYVTDAEMLELIAGKPIGITYTISNEDLTQPNE